MTTTASKTPDVPETLLSKAEVSHLRALNSHFDAHGEGWWIDTRFRVEDEPAQSLRDLERKGYIKLTNKLASGPLRIPTGVWGAIITPAGRTIARLLRL